MTQRTLAVLVVLNVALIAALSVTLGTPPRAEAQLGASRSYTMISGDVTGRSNQAAVYIIDTATSRIVPIFYNASNRRFEFFSGRDLTNDVQDIDRSR
ncbi:MAG: hypothetical protein AAF800_12050 [Planctomycetota bacterium]